MMMVLLKAICSNIVWYIARSIGVNMFMIFRVPYMLIECDKHNSPSLHINLIMYTHKIFSLTCFFLSIAL